MCVWVAWRRKDGRGISRTKKGKSGEQEKELLRRMMCSFRHYKYYNEFTKKMKR